jgi:hypothetical protein
VLAVVPVAPGTFLAIAAAAAVAGALAAMASSRGILVPVVVELLLGVALGPRAIGLHVRLRGARHGDGSSIAAADLLALMVSPAPGGVAERLNAAASKAVVRHLAYREFESLPLRP